MESMEVCKASGLCLWGSRYTTTRTAALKKVDDLAGKGRAFYPYEDFNTISRAEARKLRKAITAGKPVTINYERRQMTAEEIEQLLKTEARG